MPIYVVTPIEESKRQSMTRLVCNLIVSQGHVPVAPRLYFRVNAKTWGLWETEVCFRSAILIQ